MSQPEYQANYGTPDQLPPGEATQLNEAVAALPPAEAESLPAEASATQEPAVAPYSPTTEDDAFITGPTTRPDEPQWVGTEGESRLSGTVRTQLPALQRAAAEPGASAELQALVGYLLRTA